MGPDKKQRRPPAKGLQWTAGLPVDASHCYPTGPSSSTNIQNVFRRKFSGVSA